jgi:hypothetical protein
VGSGAEVCDVSAEEIEYLISGIFFVGTHVLYGVEVLVVPSGGGALLGLFIATYFRDNPVT